LRRYKEAQGTDDSSHFFPSTIPAISPTSRTTDRRRDAQLKKSPALSNARPSIEVRRVALAGRRPARVLAEVPIKPSKLYNSKLHMLICAAKRTTSNLILVFAASLPLVAALAGCTDRGDTPPARAQAVPVVVAQVTRRSIPVELTAIGAGQAFKTVSVESQVAGIVNEVHYRPGNYVERGNLLVTLDDRPFLAALAQAQANLTRDKAQAKLQQTEVNRYQQLFQQGIAPREQYDEYQATAASSAATVAADEAAVQTARIQLSYSSIYAPISGVVGAQLVYPGAAVKANDLPVLVVINQVSPIYVTFAVPQQYLGSIKAFLARSRIPVEATPRGDTQSESGELTFINNTVDAATGTIQLMGTFANADHRLWPGQFANVTLRLAEQRNALVIPSQSVQTGQDGDYVFVVGPDQTVSVEGVKVGRTVNGVTEILSGLREGQTVVTDGQIRLVAGTKVYFTNGL
jgi:membrane fusion protein, multidrug efflux system